MSTADEISLRPLSLRPGAGVNPFASFAFGAGAGLKSKTAAAKTEEKKKPRGEVIRYSPEFLMRFAAVYTQAPAELAINNNDIVLDPSDPEHEAQRALLQRVAAIEDDDRDWRTRTPLPPPATGKDAATDPNAPKIQRAADLGRTAWAPVAPATGNEPKQASQVDTASQSLRKVKGILNKLTPEKFERLLSQLIPLVSSYDVLLGTIVQVFENAVAQPTFVAMYADLCAELDAALPEFEGPEGPQSFKKMLANTCQEEYEATEAARAHSTTARGEEREELEGKAKQRLLGNVRLIAELFKKDMVNDRIMLLILSDLLGPSDQEPPEDNIEAACEVVATAGAALETNARSKARLDNVFAHLGRLSNSKSYAPRIRFVIRDVIDLRSQHWVARRETFTAKKLDEIRTEAQAELGIVDVAIPGLEPLPGMDVLPGIAGSKRPDEMELFPAFKGSDLPVGGSVAASASAGAADGKFSAFLGEFVPLPDSTTATPPEASGQAPRAPRTDLSLDERKSLARSLYSDFLASSNLNEAVAAAQELVIPGFGHDLVRIGIDKAFDSLIEAEQVAIAGLIIDLAANSAVTADDIRSAVDDHVVELEDIALDVPAAPKVLGRVMGIAAARGLFGLDVAGEQAKAVEGAEPRRAFIAAALLAYKEIQGSKVVEAVKEAGMDLAQLLDKDDEFESHLPTASQFAKDIGIANLL